MKRRGWNPWSQVMMRRRLLQLRTLDPTRYPSERPPVVVRSAKGRRRTDRANGGSRTSINQTLLSLNYDPVFQQLLPSAIFFQYGSTTFHSISPLNHILRHAFLYHRLFNHHCPHFRYLVRPQRRRSPSLRKYSRVD